MPNDVSFRDAGHHPLALRTLNAVAGRVAPGRPSLAPERLMAAACRQTRLDDFGDPGFREGLDVLCDSLEHEARLHTLGRNALRGMLLATLGTRLKLVDWARSNPAVREERIVSPFIVCGMPRTGTTLLSYLLDLDPRSRSIRSWEARAPIPPPELATREEDPRIAEDARSCEQMTRLIPPLNAMHAFGATLPTECVPFLALDFRSLQFETQGLLPSYGSWLEKTDIRGAYAIHALALAALQSTIPTDRWSLKTPQHLWHLDAVFAQYPDARMIWTHRDPARVIPSVASLTTAFHRTWSGHADPKRIGPAWNRKLHLAVSRGIEFDERSTGHDERRSGRAGEASGGRPWCCHVQYEDLLEDPVAAVGRIYAHFGEEVEPLHARLMRAWMRARPQSAHGRHRYDMADFGFSIDEIDEQYADYRERFDVPRELRD